MQPDPVLFAELEADEAAVERFISTSNAETKTRLTGPGFQADISRAKTLIEDPTNIQGVARRGDWIYTYKQSPDHPRGRWMRRPQTDQLDDPAGWVPIFDLDAFCAETGEEWHWQRPATASFDPDLIMLQLSLRGSDRSRWVEFDCRPESIVEGGFDIPPDRGGVDWLDRDTLIWSTAVGEGCATRSGWPRVIKRLSRGMHLDEAPVIFEGQSDDLSTYGYAVRGDDGPVLCASRYLEIGKEQVAILRADGTTSLLPCPPDTTVFNTGSHYAYVVKQTGGMPGTLMLGEIGGGPARATSVPSERRFVQDDKILLLRRWLIWSEADNLRQRLFVLNLEAAHPAPVEVELPETGDAFWITAFDASPAADDETLLVRISGFLLSPRLYLLDLSQSDHKRSWRKLWEMPASFDAAGLEVTLLEAVSDDGTVVPYHLVAPKDRGPDMPVLLYGYGGYGISVNPHYNQTLGALWLERGGAYAVGHIRGGGEFGPDWHRSAIRDQRFKSFEDFAAIARDLDNRDIARPKRIACHGRSNGGLLCGVMLTRYPTLFGAVWASVGVFDMLRFHLFPAGRGWIDEYGDPDDPVAAGWLHAYSPLHQVPDKCDQSLPPCLIDTNSGDDRVDPSHARRIAAVLQGKGHDALFYQHASGGHSGGAASDDQALEAVIGYSFLWQTVGR